MEFKAVVRDDYELVRQFLSGVGWQDRVSDPEKFTQMMENTSRSVMACEGPRIVGFARAVSDEVSNGYISMVAVAPDRRGHGIGREMVQRLIKDEVGITWVLRAGRGSSGFWKKLGFQFSTTAMERIRS